MKTLSHLTRITGRPQMVNIAGKAQTQRTAKAFGRVRLSPEAWRTLTEHPEQQPKGDVLTVAQLAGIMASKQTHQLIPLCHPIALSHTGIQLTLNPQHSSVDIVAECRCTGQTGVEMEAMTACSVAALTVYDMIKAVDPLSIIEKVQLLEKTGGKSGVWTRSG